MRITRPLLLLMTVMLVLVACTPVTPPVTPEPPLVGPPDVSLPLDLGSLSPRDILLQRDYEPGFTRPELHSVFGRVSPFTLYADGTLVYLREGERESDQRIMQVTLSPEETLDLVQKVLLAGFERLESYTDFCKDLGNGSQECVADAGITILRVRLPGGDFREVKIYHDFANDPAALEQIDSLLMGYEHPDAQSYEPEGATLFIRPLVEAIGVTTQNWPLDRKWLADLDFGASDMVAVPLTGENLTMMLSVFSSNIGDAFFSLDGRDYAAYLVPWMPGVDFSGEIQRQHPGISEIPPRSLSRFSECWIVEPPVLGTLRLAWIEAGDLWVWDWPEGEPYMLPATGDVTDVRLSSDAQTILYVQKMQRGSELWAVNADGTNQRQLAGGDQLSGELEMESLSPDERLLAFSHRIPGSGGELWAASLDGSSARRLVSQEDLMAIMTEPLADFANPGRVTWIPNTHTLTYDAFPGFENDGIYIYVQRQVMAVDADSGVREVLLPYGEGGQVDYSPDGTTMAIVTPERLRFMDIKSRAIRDADFEYFAVGFGEFYAHPPMVWTPDSQSLLVAQPASDAWEQDVPVTIWSQPRDGFPAVKVAEFSGFFTSFAFSPDQTRIAYWRAIAPQSNTRELHIAALDGSQHIVYETAEALDFLGWGLDSQTFTFATGGWPGNARLANICEDPVPMGLDFYPGNLTWLNLIRFLFERRDEGVFELYLGMVEDPASPTLLLNLDRFGGYDFAVLPVR